MLKVQLWRCDLPYVSVDSRGKTESSCCWVVRSVATLVVFQCRVIGLFVTFYCFISIVRVLARIRVNYIVANCLFLC